MACLWLAPVMILCWSWQAWACSSKDLHRRVQAGDNSAEGCYSQDAQGKFFANFKVRSFNDDTYKITFGISDSKSVWDPSDDKILDSDTCCSTTKQWHDNWWHKEQYTTTLDADNRLKTNMYVYTHCIKPGSGTHCQIKFDYLTWGHKSEGWFSRLHADVGEEVDHVEPAHFLFPAMIPALGLSIAFVAALAVYRVKCWHSPVLLQSEPEQIE